MKRYDGLEPYRPDGPFNRTKLELKRAGSPVVAANTSAFNRTKLELKPVRVLWENGKQSAFNRTKLELKLSARRIWAVSSLPLIAPSWN